MVASIRRNDRRKLLNGEHVEVRSLEDGLKGSWHPGVIILCGESVRHVEYIHLVNDDNLLRLREPIHVSPSIEGLIWKPLRGYRGNIRPLPPCYGICKPLLGYGSCVDALVNDAWWEGVIFDDNTLSQSRLVFFPDEGDQSMFNVNELRITQDWNEISGDWKPRGKWLFLSAIKKLGLEGMLPVSVRQIWYDARIDSAFEGREWTCEVRLLWEKLVFDAIKENQVAANGIDAIDLFSERENTSVCINEDKEHTDDFAIQTAQNVGLDGLTEFYMAGTCSNQLELPPEDSSGLTDVAVLLAEFSSSMNICNDEQCLPAPQYLLSLPSDPQSGTIIPVEKLILEGREDEVSEGSKGVVFENNASQRRKAIGKEPTLEPKNCGQELADYIAECENGSHKRRRCTDVQSKAMNYLLNRGWEYRTSSSTKVKYYKSPNGSRYYNFVEACRAQKKDEEVRIAQTNVNGGRGENLMYSDHGADANGRENEAGTASRKKGIWQPVVSNLIHEAEYSSQAKQIFVHDKTKLEVTKLTNATLKEWKNLSDLGWKIEYKKDVHFVRYRYISPGGKCYYSVREACKALNPEDKLQTSKNDHGVQGQHSGCTPEFSMANTDLMDDTMGTVEHRSSIKRKVRKNIDSEDFVVVDKEYCPQAIMEYYNLGLRKRKHEKDHRKEDIKHVKLKAKKHLSYMGWEFWYISKTWKGSERRELRYGSPTSGIFCSLRTACYAAMAEEKTLRASRLVEGRKSVGLSTDMEFKDDPSTIICTEFEESMQLLPEQCRMDTALTSGTSQLNKLEFGKEQVRRIRECQKRRTNTEADVDFSADSPKLKKVKASRALVKQRDNSNMDCPTRVLRSSKRAKQVVELCKGHQHTAHTILSWLISKDALLPRQNVCCKNKKDNRIMADGRITCRGIKCRCCNKVYTLAGFVAHAGIHSHRPSANIFLEDGRSLLQCQMEMVSRDKVKGFIPDPHVKMQRDDIYQNDYICSICHYGGDLILCDRCPSSFHLICIGLEDVPEGDWFCPSCRCGICGHVEFNSDNTRETILYCDQCECEHHVGCLRKIGSPRRETYPEGNFFCSKKCSKIFMSLHKLLGRSNPTASEGISWTILRSREKGRQDLDTADNEATAEYHSKLSVALGVLNECFSNIAEPHTNSKNIIEDVIFNKGSELNRLNFRGFYTMLLEKGEELISVAIFRIYGKKVAEMPLVGTCSQYRRQGMCRILVNALEKMLSELGVERLLLPAVPQMIETWTSSFGYTKMGYSDRFEFLNYIFLDFPDTTMCQKLLTTSATNTIKSRENRDKLGSGTGRSNKELDCNKDSIISVIETVEPITMMPTEDIQAISLHSEADTRENIGYLTDAAHDSLPCSDCSGTMVPFQEPELDQSETVEHTSMDVAECNGRDGHISIETAPQTIEATNCKSQFRGMCYKRRSRTFTKNESPVKRFNARGDEKGLTNNFFKYFYKRRGILKGRSRLGTCV